MLLTAYIFETTLRGAGHGAEGASCWPQSKLQRTNDAASGV